MQQMRWSKEVDCLLENGRHQCPYPPMRAAFPRAQNIGQIHTVRDLLFLEVLDDAPREIEVYCS